MQTLNKMKEKLEKEACEHKQAKQQVSELSTRLHDLSTVGFFICLFGFFQRYTSVCLTIGGQKKLTCVAIS